jgi:transposase
MARAFDDDLRGKFLAAYDRGTASLRTVALHFGVSYGWGAKLVAQRRKTGQAERVRHRPGPSSRMTPEIEAYVRAQIAQRSDLTLAELQRLLRADLQVRFSIGRLWQLLRALDLRLKKSRSTRPNGTAKPTGSVGRSILPASGKLLRRG